MEVGVLGDEQETDAGVCKARTKACPTAAAPGETTEASSLPVVLLEAGRRESWL